MSHSSKSRPVADNGIIIFLYSKKTRYSMSDQNSLKHKCRCWTLVNMDWCLCVRSQCSVVKTAEWIQLVFGTHRCFLPLIHCVIRKFDLTKNKGTFASGNLSQTLDLEKCRYTPTTLEKCC